MIASQAENRQDYGFRADCPDKPFVVAAIPAYDEERTIANVIRQACKYVDKVVVCDDGSKDTTAQIAMRLGADVVKHEKNMGYGAAIQSLFGRAKELNADIIVTLDGDGQHDPQEIPNIVEPIAQNKTDIVIGSRFQNAKGTSEMRFYRRIGARLITKLVNLSLQDDVSDAQSGFRAYSRRALGQLRVCESGMGASVRILLDASRRGLKISEVPASCRYNVGVETSTKNPVTHGASVVMSIVHFVLKGRLLPISNSGVLLDKNLLRPLSKRQILISKSLPQPVDNPTWSEPTVSVVIPVKNGENGIGECLKAVFSQSLSPFEVILVDGGSRDKTVELAKHYPVKILHETYGTVGGARQEGIENSNGAYVAFTDADCIPERDWLKNLIGEFDEETVGVGGGIRNVGHNLWEKSIALSADTFLGSARSVQGRLFKGKRFVKSLSGCNSIYRRETLLKAGGFNTALSMNEETELNRRLSREGRLTYTPNAVILHDQRRGLRAFANQMVEYGRGRGKLRLWDLQCIPPLAVPLLFLPFVLAGYLFLGSVVFFAAVLVVYAGVLFGMGSKIALKNSSMRYLISMPIVYLVEHASYTVGFWKGLFEGFRPGDKS